MADGGGGGLPEVADAGERARDQDDAEPPFTGGGRGSVLPLAEFQGRSIRESPQKSRKSVGQSLEHPAGFRGIQNHTLKKKGLLLAAFI